VIDERLTTSFWLSEFLRSDQATRKGIPNIPAPAEMQNIRGILAPGMQQVRDTLRSPVHITSGYRSPELNRVVGGAANSQHMQGLAADFVCPTLGSPRTVAEWLLAHAINLQFQQLIFEGDWVHIGFPPPGERPKKQVLTAHFGPGGVSYTEGLR
jgi:hypothetical protein